MGEIKSAFERAWERAKRIEVDDGELKEIQYVPEGERIAASFLKEEDFDLVSKIQSFPEDVRGFVLKGVSSVLLSNINLPKSNRHREENRRALQGLKQIKHDKSFLSHIISRIESLFALYERDRQKYYEALRSEFDKKIRDALAQQGIRITAPIHVERYAEFQQQWQKISRQLDGEYEGQLSALKSEIERIR